MSKFLHMLSDYFIFIFIFLLFFNSNFFLLFISSVDSFVSNGPQFCYFVLSVILLCLYFVIDRRLNELFFSFFFQLLPSSPGQQRMYSTTNLKYNLDYTETNEKERQEREKEIDRLYRNFYANHFLIKIDKQPRFQKLMVKIN